MHQSHCHINPLNYVINSNDVYTLSYEVLHFHVTEQKITRGHLTFDTQLYNLLKKINVEVALCWYCL